MVSESIGNFYGVYIDGHLNFTNLNITDGKALFNYIIAMIL